MVTDHLSDLLADCTYSMNKQTNKAHKNKRVTVRLKLEEVLFLFEFKLPPSGHCQKRFSHHFEDLQEVFIAQMILYEEGATIQH